VSEAAAEAAGVRRAWWGEWGIALGEMRHWRIGPLDLWIEFRRHEWSIQRRRGTDPLDAGLVIAAPVTTVDAGPGELEVDRVSTADPDGRVALAPRHADRTLIVRPRSPFHILEGSRVDLFVSSPLWLAITAGTLDGHTVLELPIHRPSDTWFGPSTRQGEAAYAATTSCRVDLDGLPVRPHRAVTPLHVDNPGPGPLAFDRIAVPVPNLSLYADASGRLWTEAISLTRRDEEGGLADMEMLPGAPTHAGAALRISGPREASEKRILRVFESLF
jgi:hypothetical protein